MAFKYGLGHLVHCPTVAQKEGINPLFKMLWHFPAQNFESKTDGGSTQHRAAVDDISKLLFRPEPVKSWFVRHFV
jgi:hypothetical protein